MFFYDKKNHIKFLPLHDNIFFNNSGKKTTNNTVNGIQNKLSIIKEINQKLINKIPIKILLVWYNNKL